MNTLPTGPQPVAQVSSELQAGVLAQPSVAQSVAMPLQPGGAQSADPMAEAVFNMLIDATGHAAEAVPPETVPPNANGGFPALSGGAFAQPSPLLQNPPTTAASNPTLPPNLAPPMAQATQAAQTVLANPQPPVAQRAVPAALTPVASQVPVPAKGLDAMATPVAVALADAGAVSAQPGSAAPVTQIAMPAFNWQPPQASEAAKPWHPRRDEGDAHDEHLPPDDDSEDAQSEEAPKPPAPPKEEASAPSTDLQAMTAPHPESSVAGLFEQVCEALEAHAGRDDADDAVHHVLAELSRRRRVVVISPDRVVQGRRVPVHVDVLCPEQRGGVAVRLAGELMWKEEVGVREWYSAHVFKSQSPNEGNKFQPVTGSVGTHPVMIALGSQVIPVHAWSAVCIRIADANRLWQMLSNQWSLRVVISPEPLFIHRYSS